MTVAAQREIEERLKRLVIHLTWTGVGGKLKHGTAFFVTRSGVALTAFHNIEESLTEDSSAWIGGRWQGKDLRLHWKLPQPEHRSWQREHDIAVLEAEEAAEGIEPLEAGFLDTALDGAQRGAHWRGSHVLTAGFAKGHEFELASGSGYIDHAKPLDSMEVQGVRREGLLNFTSSVISDGLRDGPGLSGSPVYSVADGAIAGITVATRNTLYAAELGPIHKHWEESGRFLKRIRRRSSGAGGAESWARASIAAGLAALALGGWLWWRQTRHEIPVQLSAEVSRIESGSSGAVSDGTRFKVGEKVRFHFTSPKNGHLYVIDQEIVGGAPGEPQIIFPTLRTGAGRNLVTAGTVVDFPAAGDVPPYLEAAAPDEPGYQGELLTLLIFSEPLPLALKETPVPLEPALFSLDGLRPRAFIHPLAPSADALAMRHIRLNVDR
jgi:hypothetical protein